MSQSVAAYIAGFVDGEGYLGLQPNHSFGEPYYQPVLKIANTNREIMDWFHRSFGGSLYVRKYEDSKNKDGHVWSLNGRKLRPFLAVITPFLRIKRRQAEILIEKYRLQDRHQGTPYSPEEKTRIQNLYEEMRSLNKKGKPSCTLND